MTPKKIGLVLSGGATHGFAQIGALKILEEKGIKPDLIVGCSVGSLLGAALASGKSMKEIEKAVLDVNMVTLLKPNLYGAGFIKGEKIVEFLLKTINVKTFEDLKIDLIVNATNLKTGEEIVFKKGNLLPALSASIAVPGIFAPIKHEENLLVDGGFHNIVPLHLAKEMDILIIIDVSKVDEEINSKSNIITILKQSIVNLQQHIIDLKLRAAPKKQKIIIIKPAVTKYGLMEYKKSRYNEMIKIGEKEAEKVLGEKNTKKILGIK
ncbi:MAG: patatin-like phospholipase family protein [Candidatus Nanoarchaeia archaeon]